MAYCQSELYVEYMIARGGSDALRKMVAAYAENPATDAAIRKVFGVSQAEFEHGYTAFLRKQIDATPVLAVGRRRSRSTNWKSPTAGSRKTRTSQPAWPWPISSAARRRRPTELVAECLKLQPRQPLATCVLVRLQKAGTSKEAMAQLESCLDRNAPDPLVLDLLAGTKLKAEKYDEAADLYALGERFDPANPRWTAASGRVFMASGQKQKLARTLAHFAELEPDDLPSRKKLAELALERREPAVARRWATEALEIQMDDAEVHRLLAAALVELNALDEAVEEFEAAIDIDPAHLQQRLALADALVQARQPAKAKKVLEELLRRDPQFPGAKALLESLRQKP